MKYDTVAKFTEFLEEELHVSCIMFNFEITNLNFHYKDKSLTLTAETCNYSGFPNTNEVFLVLIKETILQMIIENDLIDEEFTFEYNREKLHKLLITKSDALLEWFNIFLYQFSFIKIANIQFSGQDIFIKVINNLPALCSDERYNHYRRIKIEHFQQVLMQHNIKEFDLINLQNELNTHLDFLKNREKYYLITYYLKDKKYSRDEYEAKLKGNT